MILLSLYLGVIFAENLEYWAKKNSAGYMGKFFLWVSELFHWVYEFRNFAYMYEVRGKLKISLVINCIADCSCSYQSPGTTADSALVEWLFSVYLLVLSC